MAGPAVPKTLALCADDFGLTPAIDGAILALAAARRLTEVSCLVNGERWPQAARNLTALPVVRQGKVRTGLHFNLTEGRPVSPTLRALWPQFPTLQNLIVLAHLRRLPLAELRDELQAQMRAYEQARGRAPAHLDGHQHVHHLPGVREIVTAQLAPRADIRVRHTGRVQGPGYAVKRLLIEGTGGRALGRQLEATQRHMNTHLLGVYDFMDPDYRGLMQRWLGALPDHGGLIFCHPGAADKADKADAADTTAKARKAPEPAAADAIAAARVHEAAYLGSDDFAADLQAASVTLA